MRSLCVLNLMHKCWQLCHDRCHFPLALLHPSSFMLFYNSEVYSLASEETMKPFNCVPHQRQMSCIKVNQTTRCKYLIFGLYQPPQDAPRDPPLPTPSHLNPAPEFIVCNIIFASALSPAFLSDIPCKSSFLSLSNTVFLFFVGNQTSRLHN